MAPGERHFDRSSRTHSAWLTHPRCLPRLQVLKVGTSSLVRPEQQTLNLSSLARICDTIKVLHTKGTALQRASPRPQSLAAHNAAQPQPPLTRNGAGRRTHSKRKEQGRALTSLRLRQLRAPDTFA